MFREPVGSVQGLLSTRARAKRVNWGAAPLDTSEPLDQFNLYICNLY